MIAGRRLIGAAKVLVPTRFRPKLRHVAERHGFVEPLPAPFRYPFRELVRAGSPYYPTWRCGVDKPFRDQVEGAEREIILNALAFTQDNVTEAAVVLIPNRGVEADGAYAELAERGHLGGRNFQDLRQFGITRLATVLFCEFLDGAI